MWVDDQARSELIRDRQSGVPVGFILECVWRSDWVVFDEVNGLSRLLTGFKEIPDPLPQRGSPQNYHRGAWIFEAQLRSQRVNPLGDLQRPINLEPIASPVRVESNALVKDCART